MAGSMSDSGGSVKLEWKIDDEAEPSWAPALRNLDAPGPSRLSSNGWTNEETSSTSLLKAYMGMGFPKEMVVKAIKEIVNTDENALLELLLTYKALEDGDDLDFESLDGDSDVGGTDPGSDGSSDEFTQDMSEKDEKVNSLVDMGFSKDEANMAITRCGVDVDLCVLVDSISASRIDEDFHSRNLSGYQVSDRFFDSFGGRKKARLMEQIKKKRKQNVGRAQENQPFLDGNHDEPMPLPNPMVGFNLPSYKRPSVIRILPKQDRGPPFFYYENVAQAPKGVWTTISRFLYDIQPEFVDSKHLCAAARKRGYIHNLPIENRSPLLPLPPKTIFEAFPHYKKWWPSWDKRTQLNCLRTGVASSKLTERIGRAVASSSNPPARSVQTYVMNECRKGNLVWVGKNKVAPLDPEEMEYLLGFPKDHTRGLGITERYKSLGNSFQVDTVAYHLSVLRDMFPNGVNVLSLFTGIGGGEVALHRLGIHLKAVVSIEISKANKRIFRGWWDQTQTGMLIEFDDVKCFTDDRIESFVRRFGGFDLVIGGSPCNNLAGCNRYNRDGLEGEQSALFYHYFRILNAVKSAMARM